jgi:DNA-binding XRE family transcriptional regulator
MSYSSMTYPKTTTLATETADYVKVRLGDKLLAYAVKYYRDKAFLTQKQLAFFTKLPLKCIQDIENGFTKPHIKTLKKIAKHFRIDYLQLLNPITHPTANLPDPQQQEDIAMSTMQLVPKNAAQPSENRRQEIASTGGYKKTENYSDPKKIRFVLKQLGIDTQVKFMEATGQKESQHHRIRNQILNLRSVTYEMFTKKLGLKPEDFLLDEADKQAYLATKKTRKYSHSRFSNHTKKIETLPSYAAQVTEAESIYTTKKPRAMIITNDQMSVSGFVELVAKIGALSDANKKFVLEMVDKLGTK